MSWNVRRSMLLLVGGIGAFVCAVSAAGCGNGDDEGDNHATNGDAGGTSVVATGAEAGVAADGAALLSDGQIFQIVHEANLGMVAEAEMAEKQGYHPSVLGLASAIDYAQDIYDARLESYAEATDLAAVDSAQSMKIAAAAASDEAQLGGLSGAAFDSAYLADQDRAHETLLNLIDTVLVPETGAPILLTLVQSTRALVASDLARIQALETDAGAAS